MADLWQTVEQAAVSLGISVRTINRHIAAGKVASRLNDGRREVLVSVSDPDALKFAARAALQRLNALGADLPSETPLADDPTPVADASPAVRIETEYAVAPEPYAAPPEPEPAYAPEPQPAVAPAAAHTAYIDASYAPDPNAPRSFDANTFLALADSAADKAEMAVSAYQTLARLAETRVEASRRSARFAWAAVAVMAAGVTGAVGWTTHHLTSAQIEGATLRQQMSATSATVADIVKDRETLRSQLLAAKEEAARAEGQLELAAQARAELKAEVAEAKEAERERSNDSFFERLASVFDDR